MVEYNDLYAFGIPITLESMFERRTLLELVAKRLFELAAAIKQTLVALNLPLAIFVPAGIVYLIRRKRWNQIRLFSPALLWILGIFIVYPILLPIQNQGGSFKKALVTILPLLIPLGVYAIQTLIRRRELRWSIIAISLAWLVWNSYDHLRRDVTLADTYYSSIGVLAGALEELPDDSGDGQIRLMSQDPYVLSYFGYPSIVTPFASRQDTLELARLFEIDYLLMPAGRPELDPLYLGAETDTRFELVAHLAEAGEKPFELYRFVYDE